jgi:DNA-binding response OmpR family regulator
VNLLRASIAEALIQQGFSDRHLASERQKGQGADLMDLDNQTTIIVLEPDVIVRTEISDFLRECGYRVIEGVNAEDVREIIKSRTRIHVVLAEVHLTGASNGFELAQELRQTRPEIDVILVSNITNAVEKASDLCGRGPLKKPYRPEEILRRIQVLLERRRQLTKVVGVKD